jgi:hypothetical protein
VAGIYRWQLLRINMPPRFGLTGSLYIAALSLSNRSNSANTFMDSFCTNLDSAASLWASNFRFCRSSGFKDTLFIFFILRHNAISDTNDI